MIDPASQASLELIKNHRQTVADSFPGKGADIVGASQSPASGKNAVFGGGDAVLRKRDTPQASWNGHPKAKEHLVIATNRHNKLVLWGRARIEHIIPTAGQ